MMGSQPFARKILVLVTATMAFTLMGCPPKTTWTKVFGGPDEDQFYGVVAANDGGFLVAGRTWSYGAGEADMYVVKLKAGGKTAWIKTYGTAGTETAFSVARTIHGGYLLAGCTHPAAEPGCDMYAVKIDASGTVEWSNTYGDGDCDEAFNVIATSNGGYLLSGWSDAPHHRVYVVHTDASGVQQWSATLGGPTHSEAHCAVETSDGGYLVVGEDLSATTGSSDMYLAKLNDLGEAQWERTYGGAQREQGRAIVAASDGGFLLAGRSFPTAQPSRSDVYLVKINDTGDVQWSKTIGESQNHEEPKCLIATSDGGYLMTGYHYSPGTSGNLYVLKTDASGNGQWANYFGGHNGEIGEAAVEADDGGYVLAGSTWSYLASHLSGWDEGYVVKIDDWGHGSSQPTP